RWRTDTFAKNQDLEGAPHSARHREGLERQSIFETHLLKGTLRTPRTLRTLNDPHQKVRLVQKPERRHAFVVRGGLNAREVDVRRDVLLARLLQPRWNAGNVVTLDVMGERGQRACRMSHGVQLGRWMAVIDDDHEAAFEPTRRF